MPDTCANAKEDLGGVIITCFIALVSTEALRLLVRLGVKASGRDPKKFEGLIFPRSESKKPPARIGRFAVVSSMALAML